MFGIIRLRKSQPKTKKKVIELVFRNRFSAWMTKPRGEDLPDGWGGVTIPLPFVCIILYWCPYKPKDQTAKDIERAQQFWNILPYKRVHEFTHVGQDEAEACCLVYWAKYGNQLRNGYRHDRYEELAYQAEQNAYDHGLPEWAKI